MLATIDDILPGALALPDASKLLLVQRLLESISEDTAPDADLLGEVARRRAEAQADPSLFLSGAEVLSEMRAVVAAHPARP